MKVTFAALLVIVSLIVVSFAVAVPTGKTLEFTESPMGKVVFDGSVHAQAVESCKDCHKADLFPEMKKGATHITMKDIYQGKLCGVCHNGKVTFSATANCTRCHKK